MLDKFMKEHADELATIRNNVLTELQRLGEESIVFTKAYADARIREIALRYTNMGMPTRNKLAAIRRSLKNKLIQDAAYVKTKNRLPICFSAADITMPIRTREEARKLYAENKAEIDRVVEQNITQYKERDPYNYICEIADTCVVETLMYHADTPLAAVSAYFKPELMLEFEYLRAQSDNRVIAL